MRFVLPVAAVLLTGPVAFAQVQVPPELAASWNVQLVVRGTETYSPSQLKDQPPWMKMANNGMVWTPIPMLFAEKGQGAVRIDPKSKPARIAVQVGDKTIRGIYTFAPDGKKADKNRLLILFAESGADFPKAFGPDGWSAPKGFKGTAIWFDRVERVP